MSLRTDLQDAAASLAKDVLDYSYGATISYQNRANTALSLSAFPERESRELAQELEIDTEETARTFYVPMQAGLFSKVTTKALTSNVITLTTEVAHALVTSLQIRVILDTADSTVDGLYLVASVPTTTTLTYAKTASNITSVAAAGVVETVIAVNDRIVFESTTYGIRRIGNAAMRTGYKLDCIRVQAQRVGMRP